MVEPCAIIWVWDRIEQCPDGSCRWPILLERGLFFFRYRWKQHIWQHTACMRHVFPDTHLAVRCCVNPVMVDSPFVPQRNGPLAGAALALADQKAPVDARAKQVLGRIAWHWSMVPAVLLQAVDRGDVVGGHPALAILGLCLAPLAVVVVTQHTQLLSWSTFEIAVSGIRQASISLYYHFNGYGSVLWFEHFLCSKPSTFCSLRILKVYNGMKRVELNPERFK